jgi:hypothetical protein
VKFYEKKTFIQPKNVKKKKIFSQKQKYELFLTINSVLKKTSIFDEKNPFLTTNFKFKQLKHLKTLILERLS